MKTPWPGMARTVFGDHQRFIDTYFSMYPGFYFTGDGGHRSVVQQQMQNDFLALSTLSSCYYSTFRDASGYWQITGRMDDVINVTGHRLGTAEVEDALVSEEGTS